MPRLWSRAATVAPTPGTAVISALKRVRTVWPAVIPASRRTVFCAGFVGALLSVFAGVGEAVVLLVELDLACSSLLEALLTGTLADGVGVGEGAPPALFCPLSLRSNSLRMARAARRLAARCIGSCWR